MSHFFVPCPGDTYWLVWNPLAGPPRFKHENEEGARREAARLASEHKGSEFIVLRTVASYQDNGVQITEHTDRPF